MILLTVLPKTDLKTMKWSILQAKHTSGVEYVRQVPWNKTIMKLPSVHLDRSIRVRDTLLWSPRRKYFPAPQDLGHCTGTLRWNRPRRVSRKCHTLTHGCAQITFSGRTSRRSVHRIHLKKGSALIEYIFMVELCFKTFISSLQPGVRFQTVCDLICYCGHLVPELIRAIGLGILVSPP